MTNEEAIKRLKQEYEGWENNHFVYEGINTYIEALKLAVNALDEERPQGDLINSLTELCNRYCENCPIIDTPNECSDCICTHIRGIIRGKEE